LSEYEPQPGGRLGWERIGGEHFVGVVVRASGGEAHDRPYRNIRRLAAKAAHTSEKGTLVKLIKRRPPDYVAVFSYVRSPLNAWAHTTIVWTRTKI
jgi:hypothetical protein